MKHKLLIEKRKIIISAGIKGINDTMDFKFILDTGSSKTIIDERVAIWLGFDLKKLKKGDRLMTAGGGIHSKILILPKLSLFGIDLIDFEVNVLNLPPQIMYFVDGLIGMDFLMQLKSIKFDFDEKTIETKGI